MEIEHRGIRRIKPTSKKKNKREECRHEFIRCCMREKHFFHLGKSIKMEALNR